MDGTAEAVEGACRAHLVHGTTSLCPTTLTSTDEELFTFFDCYRKAKKHMKNGPDLLGIHMEGPYFSMEQRGAQDPNYLKIPAEHDYRAMLDRSEDVVRVSAAPELPGALELADELYISDTQLGKLINRINRRMAQRYDYGEYPILKMNGKLVLKMTEQETRKYYLFYVCLLYTSPSPRD